MPAMAHPTRPRRPDDGIEATHHTAPAGEARRADTHSRPRRRRQPRPAAADPDPDAARRTHDQPGRSLPPPDQPRPPPSPRHRRKARPRAPHPRPRPGVLSPQNPADMANHDQLRDHARRSHHQRRPLPRHHQRPARTPHQPQPVHPDHPGHRTRTRPVQGLLTNRPAPRRRRTSTLLHPRHGHEMDHPGELARNPSCCPPTTRLRAASRFYVTRRLTAT